MSVSDQTNEVKEILKPKIILCFLKRQEHPTILW